MKKILFIALFILLAGSFAIPVKAQVTQETLNAQIDELKQTLITLLMQYVQELQAQLATLQASQVAQATQVQEIQAQVDLIPTNTPTPIPTPVPTPENIFNFDFSINVSGLRKITNSDAHIKIPGASYLALVKGFSYVVDFKVSNQEGNLFTCATDGFNHEGIFDLDGNNRTEYFQRVISSSFNQNFPEKKIYVLTLTCTDRTTGKVESGTLTVDTN